MQNIKIALRMDDVGSASKMNEIYGHTRFLFGPIQIPFPGNFLFLKYIKPFRGWGPYPELTVLEWERVFEYCKKNEIKLTLGITAGWVQYSSDVIPFPEKFSAQAELIKKAVKAGLVEVANHGYTHCVLEDRAFRPRLFSANRKWHREFWDWVPLEIQERNIAISQKILETFFGEAVVTFIPPGNVFINETLRLAEKYGLKYLSCKGIDQQKTQHLIAIPENQVIAFHDKELVENGTAWFLKNERDWRTKHVSFIKEIGHELETKVAK